MKALLTLLAFIATAAASTFGATETIRRASDIMAVTRADATPDGVPFDIEAWIVYPDRVGNESKRSIILKDDSGTAILQDYITGTNISLNAGDLVRAKGRILNMANGVYAHCHTATRLAHKEPDPPVKLTVEELLSGRFDGRMATVRGEVCDVFLDEIDSKYLYFILKDGNKSIYMAATTNICTSLRHDSLIGLTVEATGICMFGGNSGMRRHIGRILGLCEADPIRIIKAPKIDIFNTPEITDMRTLMPNEVPPLERRRVMGTVIASWHGDQTLVKTDDGSLVRLNLSSGPVPQAGLRIEAVGFPETDLYTINLNHVRWRRTEGAALPAAPPVCMKTWRKNNGGRVPGFMQAGLHGQSVLIEGIVRGLPQEGSDGRLILESADQLLPIDFSFCPNVLSGLTVGCFVEICGTWVMETDSWRPNAVFPKIRSAFVVVNSPDGLRVLARPSWWTAGRSLTVIGILLAILFGVVAWNRSLKAIAERRGRELFEERVAHVASDLRVGERTSLAVELHDTIAQNLTGVALEINAANKLIDSDLSGAHRHLDTAAKTLSSCRTELKNCLFDLRGNTLGQRDMDAAIRLSVAPVIGDAELTVRFNVPRERITDASAHAIIRIVRELASNAVRHGGAQKVRIAGTVEAGALLFSVSDDGCGFVVEQAPGIDECHFGLQGIRDRVARFKGKMNIESTPGKGTHVSVTIST